MAESCEASPRLGGGPAGNNGSLFGLDAATGMTKYNAPNLGAVTHFVTPSAGQGRIHVAVGDQVMAFGQPRAEGTLPMPASGSVTRGQPPPHVPQTPAGPRPSVSLADVLPVAKKAGDEIDQLLPDVMRRIIQDLLAQT